MTERPEMLIVGSATFDRLAPLARRHGYQPVESSQPPTARQLAAVDGIAVPPEHFDDLVVSALADHDTGVWITDTDDPWTQPISSVGRIVKRVIDLTIGLGILLFAAPVWLLVALAIRLDSPGPVLHSQPRLGRDGRWFDMHKFRTMQVENDATAHTDYFEQMAAGEAATNDGLYKIVDDPRITRVGRLLRRFSIDEIPQFLDVVRGPMSVTGPRPMLPRELRTLDARAWNRHRVKPGITGLWQVSGRSTTTFAEMIDLDLEYVSNWSVSRELRILFATPAAILREETA